MLRRFFKTLTGIVYPKVCLGCNDKLKTQTTEEYICNQCWSKIKKNTPPFCLSCGRHLDNNTKGVCVDCLRKRLHFDRAFSPCLYDGVLKELLHQFKYRGKEYLAKPLSKLMIDFIREFELPIEYLDYIVPTPLHRSRLRQREFNQAELLSKQIACEFNKKIENKTLMRRINTRTQTELPVVKRMQNVKECFFVEKTGVFKGKNILLVDDVLTTGATSSEAALTLKNAGANIVFVLTLAN